MADTLVVPTTFNLATILRIPLAALTSLAGGTSFTTSALAYTLTFPSTALQISNDGLRVYLDPAGATNLVLTLTDGTVTATVTIQVSDTVTAPMLNGVPLSLNSAMGGAASSGSIAPSQNFTPVTVNPNGIHVTRDAGVW